MEKKKTPASTVVFYIIGIIFLIVSLFMLWTAVSYTQNYLQTYDASFNDMWSNSVQYVIAQFLPYCGIGIICLGIGRAIKGSANAGAPQSARQADQVSEEGPQESKSAIVELSSEQLEELARRIDTNREVLSIKIEEKEKRDSYRIKELEKKVEGALADYRYINEPLEELVYKQAAGEDMAAAQPAKTSEEMAEAGPVPQIFRMARTMTMPSVSAAAPAAEKNAPAAGAVPQIMRMADIMSMPSVPKQ